MKYRVLKILHHHNTALLLEFIFSHIQKLKIKSCNFPYKTVLTKG